MLSCLLLTTLLLSAGVSGAGANPAPAPLPSPSPSPDRLVTLGFTDPGARVNATEEVATGFPPVPEGLTVVTEAPAIGLVVCALDPDVTLTPADFCARVTLVHPEIAFCEPDTATGTISSNATVSATPDDPLYPQQYSPGAIGLPAAWSSAQLFGSTAIHVCMIDTGVDTTHQDIAASVVNGTAFIAAQEVADYTDGNSHGTFTAGTLRL